MERRGRDSLCADCCRRPVCRNCLYRSRISRMVKCRTIYRRNTANSRNATKTTQTRRGPIHRSPWILMKVPVSIPRRLRRLHQALPRQHRWIVRRRRSARKNALPLRPRPARTTPTVAQPARQATPLPRRRRTLPTRPPRRLRVRPLLVLARRHLPRRDHPLRPRTRLTASRPSTAPRPSPMPTTPRSSPGCPAAATSPSPTPTPANVADYATCGGHHGTITKAAARKPRPHPRCHAFRWSKRAVDGENSSLDCQNLIRVRPLRVLRPQ
jgi:hypothetical protein